MYAHVENGLVTETLFALPQAWTWPDGRKCGNFDLLLAADQVAAGVYPLVDVTPLFDPLLQRRSATFSDVVLADRVERTHVIESIPIGDLKTDKLTDVGMRRDGLLAGSVFTYGTDQFDFNRETLINASSLQSSRTNGNLIGLQPIPWRKHGGGYRMMDDADFTAFAGAIDAHAKAIWGAAYLHEQAINALATPAEVVAYDTSTGWPA